MNYKSLSINQKINAKGNARFLYTIYSKLMMNSIVKRDPAMFTPEMLLDGNTKTI
jgi:hypothetical protein